MRYPMQFLIDRWRSRRSDKTRPFATVDPRRWFLVVFVVTLLILIFIGALVYVIDPFQVYRRPTLYKPVFIEAYSSIPGIIRNYDYDSIVVGSSMSQNFRISDIRTLLGWKSIKLTPPGCRPATAKVFMTAAFNRKRIKNVLYSLDIPSYTKGIDTHHTPLPKYLYDESPWNDYLYLWNQTVISEGIVKVFKAVSGRKRYRLKQNEDQMWSWDVADGYRQYGAETVARKERTRGKALGGDTLDRSMPAEMRESLVVNQLNLIREHPQVSFVVFFPPYSIQAWYNARASGNLDVFLQFKRNACELLLACPNVRIFDFQSDRDIICNFDNYKDGTHFSPAISRLILERIANDEDRVQPGSMAANERRLRQLIQTYEDAGPLVP